MTQPPEISGLVPMLVTPFTESDEIDVDALRSLVRFQLASGVDGVAVLGFGGEGYAVLDEERESVIAAVADELARRVPLVVGIAATSARHAVRQAEAAQRWGADWLMVLPPFLVKPDARALVAFFEAVASATDLPVMIQDAPDVAVPLPVETLHELVQLAHVRAAKIEVIDPVPKIAEVHAVLGGRLPIVGGRGGNAVVDELTAGASGTMPFCDLTDRFREVVDFVHSGHIDRARSVHGLISPVSKWADQANIAVAVAKEILRLRGLLPNALVRNPTRGMRADELSTLRLLVEPLEII